MIEQIKRFVLSSPTPTNPFYEGLQALVSAIVTKMYEVGKSQQDFLSHWYLCKPVRGIKFEVKICVKEYSYIFIW